MKRFISGILSSLELWDDSVLSADDMEGIDGGDGKWKSHSSRVKVIYSYKALFGGIYSLLMAMSMMFLHCEINGCLEVPWF